MKNSPALWLAVLCIVFLSGCSTLETPPAKDLSLLKVGTARGVLNAELGEPLSDVKELPPHAVTKGKQGGHILLLAPLRSSSEPKLAVSRIDVFVFIQGYTRNSKKSGNEEFYDLAESGSWKRIATPTQTNFYKDLICIVKYDENDKILVVQTFHRVSRDPGGVAF